MTDDPRIQAASLALMKHLQTSTASDAPEVIQSLLNDGADPCIVVREAPPLIPSTTVLHQAVRKGNLNILKQLVPAITDVNCLDGNQQTPLHIAAYLGYSDIARWLHEQGAQLNPPDQHKQTPLYLAAEQGENETALTLIELGAAIENPDKAGRSPLMVATLKGRLSTVKALCQKGADIHTRDRDGQTLMHIAIRYNHSDLLDALMGMYKSRGQFDVNEKDNGHYGMLHHLAIFYRDDMFKMVMAEQPDLDAQTKQGATALSIASTKNPNMALALLAHDANPFIANNLGQTAFHNACTYGYRELAIELLHAGCDIDMQNGSDLSPLNLSLLRRDSGIAQLLAAEGALIRAPYNPFTSIHWVRNAIQTATENHERLIENGFDITSLSAQDIRYANNIGRAGELLTPECCLQNPQAFSSLMSQLSAGLVTSLMRQIPTLGIMLSTPDRVVSNWQSFGRSGSSPEQNR